MTALRVGRVHYAWVACDLVVASDRARFGEVFARIGLIPDAPQRTRPRRGFVSTTLSACEVRHG
jgi:hypothetical protein